MLYASQDVPVKDALDAESLDSYLQQVSALRRAAADKQQRAANQMVKRGLPKVTPKGHYGIGDVVLYRHRTGPKLSKVPRCLEAEIIDERPDQYSYKVLQSCRFTY